MRCSVNSKDVDEVPRMAPRGHEVSLPSGDGVSFRSLYTTYHILLLPESWILDFFPEPSRLVLSIPSFHLKIYLSYSRFARATLIVKSTYAFTGRQLATQRTGSGKEQFTRSYQKARVSRSGSRNQLV